MQRRKFLKLCAGGWVLCNTAPLLALDKHRQLKKIVWVMLRGAMDSLHAVVPLFDKHLLRLRGPLVSPIQQDLLPLDRGFSLHPEFKNIHRWYREKEMLAIVAVASPYASRSHFDAQDLLESGLDKTNHESGWLARALAQYRGDAIALARSVPISLRGHQKAQTWYPSSLPDAAEDLYERLEQLYENDSLLKQRLAEGLHTRASTGMNKSQRAVPQFEQLAKSCGDLLAKSKAASCAMLELGGWDTHNNQVGRLERQFTTLDKGLAALKTALGDHWSDTVVVVATEFGRTVAVNGTRGTDHGSASALLLLGGAVKGGRIMGDWPGLAKEDLFEARDLMPTSDIRSWLGAMLRDHWSLNAQQLAAVFPNVSPSAIRLVGKA